MIMRESKRHSVFRLVRILPCVTWLSLCGVPYTAAAEPSDITAQETQTQTTSKPGVVNLNTASAEELERLPGVGPSRAQAILALRATLSQFTKPEQLLRVKGIGRATFRKLRPMLTLSGPTTLAQRPRAR
jgi:competence protein ComEA